MLGFDELYSWVKDLPIVDWHNHLDLDMIAADRPLGSLYEVWVKSDPYKHRAMRICGEREELITGGEVSHGERTLLSVRNKEDKSSTERTGVCVLQACGPQRVPPSGERTLMSVRNKAAGESALEAARWAAWMRTLPKLVGNPIFAWARMELEFLGLDPEPYLHGRGENVLLANWTPSKLLKAFHAEMICPCLSGERTLLSVRNKEDKSSTERTGVCVPQVCVPQVCVPQVCVPRAVPVLREFSEAMACPSEHFCSSLKDGAAHKRNLPHIAHDGALIFLTFRLADSLPAQKLAEFAKEKDDWLKAHPEPWGLEIEAEYDELFKERIDCWLDSGIGSCILRDEDCQQAIVEVLEKFNETGDGSGRYVLHSYVIMPNHVHVLFELKDRNELSRVVQGWKGVSARKINQIRNSKGKVWQEEYFDRLIRDADHYDRTVRYIRKNALENGHSCPFGNVDDNHPQNAQECAFPRRASQNAQECAFPRRAFSVVPSLRMNAGDLISSETLESFDAAGCRVVDISVDDDDKFESEFESLSTVAAFAAAHGWTMLLHLGALRETSARLRVAAGPAGGFAGMCAPVDPQKVARFLDRLERLGERTLLSVQNKEDKSSTERTGVCVPPSSVPPSSVSPSSLPRTILLTLNPEAHAQLAVLAGSFNGAGMPGKVQLGPAWWWCDHEEGIRDVLEKNAAYGVLSTFVGMTTDSRSLLSFVRHDYFRRILCQWTAEKIAAGSFPDDETLIRPLLENICYRNAKEMVK